MSSSSRILGWRAWCLRDDGRLQSVLYDAVWEPGLPLVAECPQGHAAPLVDCECGIYAAREPEEALHYRIGRDEPNVVGRVLGRVALWGTVVECARGWRAERAYPVELADAEAARRYGVSVCLATTRSTSCAPRLASATARSSAPSTPGFSSSGA